MNDVPTWLIVVGVLVAIVTLSVLGWRQEAMDERRRSEAAELRARLWELRNEVWKCKQLLEGTNEGTNKEMAYPASVSATNMHNPQAQPRSQADEMA